MLGRISIINFFFFGTIFYSACNKEFQGTDAGNQLPETYTLIDTIIRIGDDRLTSQVNLQWWGNDADGLIQGYEFSFDSVITDETIWIYTEKQDSIFILAPEAGEDTADFIFHIRAIDNYGEKDASPARLIIPVKNSPPIISIIPGINNPIKSFPVIKYFWSASDPDGNENISQFELYFNDTTNTAFILNQSVSSATFAAQDPVVDLLSCNVYANASSLPEEIQIEGLIGDAWNRLWIRAIDQSGAKSNFAVSDSIYIKKVKSNILFVDGYASASPISFYKNGFSAVGFNTIDTIQIFEKVGGIYTQQSADNLTQEKIFSLFDVIVWFSNDANNSLSLAQKTTTTFFNDGGKMLMSVYISSSFDPLSNFLDFTPISSLTDPEDTTLILDLAAQLLPDDLSFPTLQASSIVSIVKPLELQTGAEVLYQAELTAKDNATLTFSDWNGNSVIIAKKKNLSGNTNFVFSALELQKLDGLATMNLFFEKILLDEFGL